MRLPRARRLATAATLVVSAFALLAPARPAAAAAGDRKFVSLRGRVADAAGAPLADVRVEAGGTREAIALTGLDGRFTLTLDLGALNQIQLHPVSVSVRARREGYRIAVAGGAPELAMELRLGEESGGPAMQARSNFGIIADALLEALAPPGDRTATIHVSFVAEPGAASDTSAGLPDDYRSVPIAEPWLARPAAATTPETRHGESPPKREAPPPRHEEVPPAPREAPAPAVVAPAPAEEAGPKPPRKKRAPKPPRTESTSDARARKPPRATVPREESHASSQRPGTFAAPLPAPAPGSRIDSLRIAREGEQHAAAAVAQAQRDSVFRVQRAQALARKAVVDSLRAIREAAEDSARRARFGLPPRPVAEAAAPPKPRESARRARDKSRPSSAPARADEPEAGFAPPVGAGGSAGGLQRVAVRDDAATAEGSGAATRATLAADTCTCRVRGTVETEFHRLLTSPLRIEVSIRELPALRDTIELFMGSPRAFEFERVPCGRWSIGLRPFSERPFGVVNSDAVAPFDCRQRGLRQVRVVIAPLKTGR